MKIFERIQNKIVRQSIINDRMTAKQYYKIFKPTIQKLEMKRLFIDELWDGVSVFEFGCHNGMNLEWIKEKFPTSFVFGIDLNQYSIDEGYKVKRRYIVEGDENTLKFYCGFDVAFTCSVLCHIENISSIIYELKRLANKVVLIETQEPAGRFYFPHNYELFGFKKIRTIKNNSDCGNQAYYDQWEFQK